MNKREALIEAHRQAAACIRQHIDSAGEGFADEWADSEKIEEALLELAMRHKRAVWRMEGEL